MIIARYTPRLRQPGHELWSPYGRLFDGQTYGRPYSYQNIYLGSKLVNDITGNVNK